MLKLICRKPHTHNRAEKMTDEPIRPSEDPLLVFISSRQDEELSVARGLAIKEVERYPGMKAWAFEERPSQFRTGPRPVHYKCGQGRPCDMAHRVDDHHSDS